MPERHFESSADFNAQFTDWLTTASARVVRTTKARPVGLVGTDKEAMLPLLPAVLHLGWRTHVHMDRDHYVRVDTCDYSVDPAVMGDRSWKVRSPRVPRPRRWPPAPAWLVSSRYEHASLIRTSNLPSAPGPASLATRSGAGTARASLSPQRRGPLPRSSMPFLSSSYGELLEQLPRPHRES